MPRSFATPKTPPVSAFDWSERFLEFDSPEGWKRWEERSNVSPPTVERCMLPGGKPRLPLSNRRGLLYTNSLNRGLIPVARR